MVWTAVTLLLAPMSGWATNLYTWSGASSALWSNPSNWTPNGVPTDGDTLAFPAGASNLTNTNNLAAGTTFASLVFNGSGYTLKLIANALWFEQAVATAEVLAIAVRAGLDPDTVQRALAQSAAGRGFVADEARALLAGDAMPSFALARCAAQLRTLDELAGELAVPADVLAAVARVHSDAVARYGDVDGELLGARFAAERAGVQLGA